MDSISCHTMPLVLKSLGGRDTHMHMHIYAHTHTHTYTNTHMHVDVCTEMYLETRHMLACSWGSPGLKVRIHYTI